MAKLYSFTPPDLSTTPNMKNTNKMLSTYSLSLFIQLISSLDDCVKPPATLLQLLKEPQRHQSILSALTAAAQCNIWAIIIWSAGKDLRLSASDLQIERRYDKYLDCRCHCCCHLPELFIEISKAVNYRGAVRLDYMEAMWPEETRQAIW